jgi:hypothetical protein
VVKLSCHFLRTAIRNPQSAIRNPKPMRRRSRVILALVLAVGVFAGLYVWRSIQQVSDITALQQAVGNRVDLSFNEEYHRPARLPAVVDNTVDEFLRLLTGDASRRHTFQAHFHALFRGPIDLIELDMYEPLDAQDMAALMRFTRLRRLEISQLHETTPYEACVTQLCTTVQSMPKLEEFWLWSTGISDATIVPLRGHPSLRELELHDGNLTLQSIETFRALPALRTLDLGKTTFPSDQQKALADALPGVEVRFR